MSEQQTVAPLTEGSGGRWQGAVLFLSMVVAFFVAFEQITRPRFEFSDSALRWEVTALIASAIAFALAWRMRRARTPASALLLAAMLPIYFHNFRGRPANSCLYDPDPSESGGGCLQVVLRFPKKPDWVDPTFTYLIVLAGAVVLVSLWRHKHDPNAAF